MNNFFRPLNKILTWITPLVFLFSCNTKSDQNITYLDAKLPAAKRVELLMKQMTLDEKIGQMCQYVGEPTDNALQNKDEQVSFVTGIGERAELIKQGKIGSFLKVPTFKEANQLQKLALQSRLKIPLLIATDALHGMGMYKGNTTIYPTEIGLASTFDTTLVRQIAVYTADEMRAAGYHWTFSPNIEVVHDPRWGRCGETFGEDPMLVSEMGKAMIEGYQGTDFADSVNVLACAKHFVGGGISFNGLNGGSADVSERTLYNIFFPPFQEAIKAGVYTIMPAHNDIAGIPCHAHKAYLTDLLRNIWGFKGIYVSDWMDIERLFTVHKIAKDEKDAVRLAVSAGLDVHMQGPHFFDYVKALVGSGDLSMEQVDEAVYKILYAKFQLGLFENRFVDSATVCQHLRKQEHLDLSLDAARKSIVLLKNDRQVLPLKKSIGRILVTGPLVNSQAILGDWARRQEVENIVTILEGVQSHVSPNTRIEYLPVDSYTEIEPAQLQKAEQTAKTCDAVVVAVGENSIRFDKDKTSGENLDRSSLDLQGSQLALVQALKKAGNPVIAVLVNGGPIASPGLVENVDGIIEAWEPGLYGGQAVADVLFGEYNPGGKMPISVPQTVGHIQTFYNHMPSAFHRGRFFQSTSQPLYEFGYGLSYTTFEYSNLEVPEKMNLTDDLPGKVTVNNTGSIAGDEVVLIYLNDEVSSVTTPVKKLVFFKRIHLQPGEKQDVEFVIENNKFKIYDSKMNYILEPGQFNIILGNNVLQSKVIVG